MRIRFYFDEHMPRDVERALMERGYEVIMAVDVGMEGADDDSQHLPLAAKYEAVMVTRDRPFAGRTSKRTDHAGLICWTGDQRDVGGMILKLDEFGKQYSAEEVKGKVFWIKA